VLSKKCNSTFLGKCN